jgi:transcriptional regulator with XRE-family HTH domain
MDTWKDFKSTITSLDKEKMDIIDALADLVSERAQSGIEQKEFASRIGMSQPQLAKLERLDSIPTLKTVNRYAEGLGYKVTFNIVRKTDSVIFA